MTTEDEPTFDPADDFDLADLIAQPVRHSNLKHMSASPAHYLDRLQRRHKSSQAQDVGTIAHGLLLGGGPEVVAYHGKRDLRTKAYQEFVEQNAGKLIVTPSAFATATAVAASVRRCKQAMELLDGEREKQLPAWKYGERLCTGRPDVRHPRRIVELKTGMTSDPERFPRHGARMFYHSQLDFYRQGDLLSGGTASESWIVAVETSPPFVVTCFRLTEQALEAGRKLWVTWIEELLTCEARDEWPGYSIAPVPFDVETMDDLVFGDEDEEEDDEEAA